MEIVESAEEFEEKLTEAFKDFMKYNEQFNVQGSWTGEDEVTVSVLVDYGIEDRNGDYYVGSVSARYEDNKQFNFDGDVEESDTFYNAQCAMESAIRNVFEVPHGALYPDTTKSDIDLCSHYSIGHGIWDLRDKVRIEMEDEEEAKP